VVTQPALIVSPVSFGATPFGYELRSDPDASTSSGRRSEQEVARPLFDAEHRVLGYLVLSEGPAYGTDVVNNVARALVGAGGAAILLAALAGWFASRNLSQPLLALTEATGRMADGQLATRVEMNRRDELGSLAHSFNEMAHRIESMVTMLRRFVADAAHELHTPLTAVHTNLELAASEPDSARRLKFIERAQAQLARLETLTTSLLDLTRIEANTNHDQRTPVDLVTVVRRLHEVYASRAEQAGLSINLDAPDQAVTLLANETQMMRVMDNLLDNAVKFTPEGGTVTLGLKQSEDAVQLWVQDTGIGIPAEDIPNLFSRFFRGHNVADYPGNGLGLVISKAIVEGHGGTITVESGRGGTRFSIRLPLVYARKDVSYDAQPHFAH
jgi:signal transduction histidine kinase